MDWTVSTTPIPISAPSVIIKAIMSKDMDNIPEELQHLASQNTISVQKVRQYTNIKRYQALMKLCRDEDYCRHWVNQADPEFGITPLHLAYASGDLLSIELLKSLGADSELEDNAGRKPQNLSFSKFVENSKKFARMKGREECGIFEK